MKTRSEQTSTDFEVKNLLVTGSLRDFQRKSKRLIGSYLYLGITQLQSMKSGSLLLDCEGGLDREAEEFTMTIRLRRSPRA